MNLDYERLPVGTCFHSGFVHHEILEVRERHYLVRITSRRQSGDHVIAHRFEEQAHADHLARGVCTQVAPESDRHFHYLSRDRERDPNEA